MYGKIFESMYDGTLAENWKAMVTFQQMIVLCDDVGILDMTPRALSSRTGIPLEIIEEGISFLELPDKFSRTPTEDGKRIVRLDDYRPWGWKIVNHEFYKKLASYEDKKRADRERIATKRNKNNDVASCRVESQEVADVAHTNKDTNKKKNTASNSDAAIEYLLTKKKRRLSGRRLDSFNVFWEKFGYKKGKAEAADSWLDIPEMTVKLCSEICEAAEIEAENRPDIISRGLSPKMAQGWLTARRWEDEDYQTPEASKPEPGFIGITNESCRLPS